MVVLICLALVVASLAVPIVVMGKDMNGDMMN